MATIPGKKISQLATATSLALDGTEYFTFAKAGANKKILPENIGIGGYISITYANIVAAQSGGTLKKGSLYFITDKNIYIRAADSDRLELTGHYLAYNADYQLAGDYSGVAGFNAALGIWHSGLAPVANDVVIWNNRHYKNLTGAVGTAPDGDGVNWSLLSIAVNTGHILELDAIEYDLDNDWIQMRADRRGNVFHYSKVTDQTFFGLTYSAIDDFPWGNDKCYGNKLFEAVTEYTNFRGYFGANILFPQSSLRDLTASTTTSYIVGNTFQGSTVANGGLETLDMGTDTNIYGCTFMGGVTVQTLTLSNTSGLWHCVFSQNTSGITVTEVLYNIGKVLRAAKDMTDVEVKALNGTPLEVIAAGGAGTVINLLHADYDINYNTTAYATNKQLSLIYDTATNYTMTTHADALAATVSTKRPFTRFTSGTVTDTQILANKGVNVRVETGNPTNGDSPVTIYVTYRIEFNQVY